MSKADFTLPPLTGITEHLLFVALLVPTFVLLAAVAVSLAQPDAPIAVQPALQTAAVCEPCLWDEGQQGP